MNSFRDNNEVSDIFILNNFEASQTQIKSTILQSKLQQSIQNFRQLTKPIPLHIEPKLQPLYQPEPQVTVKKSQHQKKGSEDLITEKKEVKVNRQLDFSQISVQNQQQQNENYQSYQYKKKTYDQNTNKILSHYHSSTTVKTITTFEDCFNILNDAIGYQLVRIPTNIIIDILKKREEMQHQVVQQRRLIQGLARQGLE